jgi:hypothetical protein
MSACLITRRSLIAATAGALAGGLLRPGGALALLGAPPRPLLWEHPLGRLPPEGATVRLEHSADLVGIEWGVPATAAIWLRFRTADGRWSRWASAAAHGHGPDSPAPQALVVGEPVWTGGTSTVQIRSSRPLSDVRLRLVDVSGGSGAHGLAAGASPLARAAVLAKAAPILDAGPGQPPIIARRAWAQGMAPPRVAPGYGAVRLAFVHHTENPNGYTAGEVPAMLRAIYVFHRYVRGWNDVGYNFVIDLYGRVFEARAGGIDEPVVGAHAGGYNLASTGIAILGSFMGTPISPAARDALERLLAWKLSLHGAPARGRVTVRVNPAGAVYSRFPANARVSLPRIAGHRDGDSTDCPGNALYGELPAIRARVQRLAPRPTHATLELLPAPPGSSTRTLTGSLRRIDGAPLANVPVALQARSVSPRGEVVHERTIAEAATDGEGRFSLQLSVLPAGRAAMSLRVLSAGAGGSGACVSDPLRLPGRLALSPPAGSPPSNSAPPGSLPPGSPPPGSPQPAASPTPAAAAPPAR